MYRVLLITEDSYATNLISKDRDIDIFTKKVERALNEISDKTAKVDVQFSQVASGIKMVFTACLIWKEYP